MDGRFLRKVNSYDDESLISYIARVGRANGYQKIGWILIAADINIKRQYYRINYIPHSIDKLAFLSGLSIEKITQLKYPMEDNIVHFMGNEITKWLVNPERPKFCPVCYSEKGYYKKIWDLSTLVFCPKHNTKLVDKCPHCHKRFNYNMLLKEKCDCGTKLTEFNADKCSNTIYLSEIISKRCTNESSVLEINPFFRLNLNDLNKVILFFLGIYLGESDMTGKNVRTYPLSIIQEYVLKIDEIILEWPGKFVSLLSEVQSNPEAGMASSVKAGFGNIQATLRRCLNESQFFFIHDQFKQYLSCNWDKSYLRVGKSKVYLTNKQACLKLGVMPSTLQKYINSGCLDAKVLKQKKSIIKLVTRESVTQLKRIITESIIAKDGAKILGISEVAIYEMVRRGIVQPVFKGNVKPIMFSKACLHEINRKLDLSIIADKSQKNLINFSSALLALRPIKVKKADLVELMLKGKLVANEIRNDSGLDRFYFSYNKIKQYIIECVTGDKTEEEWMSLREVKDALNIDISWFIDRWVKCGRVTYKKVNNNQYFIPATEIEKIKEEMKTYIGTVEASKMLDVDMSVVTRAIYSGKLKPISGPTIDGFGIYLLDRKEVQAYSKEYKKYSRRKS